MLIRDDEKFLIATHKKDGDQALFAKDGSNNIFGGPHYQITGIGFGFHEINEEIFLTAQNKKNGPKAIYQKDGSTASSFFDNGRTICLWHRKLHCI